MSTPGATLRVGADIGGTFTDLVFLTSDGRLDKLKVPSTPDNYARAIVEGIARYCADAGIPGTAIVEVVHATTVATNAILERKGAKTALVTTEGFRDVLELRRIRIPMSYDLGWQKPAPLVERELRFTVNERLDARGEVLTPLDAASVDAAVAAIATHEVEAVAVCLLHSYRNSAHERAIGAALAKAMPGVHVSLSCAVLPEILEFERTSTTVVNAYVAPLVGRYLRDLRTQLDSANVRAPVLVMQSNGGLISANSAADFPVSIIESGPAAGVVAAARQAHDAGLPNVITLDMGGTTTKASIIERGEMLRATEYEVGSPVSISSRLMRGNGYVLRIPVIDISEVGAGGGSLAAMDAGGSLRVGPRSAGAVPGPACYGAGNEHPTVTDANLVLGYIHPDSLAGGALRVNRNLAEAAVLRDIGQPSGMDLLEAAYGIHLVANSNMVRAIKSVSVERGRDPSDFIMMAFGGAGPIHAVGVARELGIRRVLIPPSPGVFSAFGLLRGEVEQHAARTVMVLTAEAKIAVIAQVFDEMQAELAARMRAEGLSDANLHVSRFVDLRYRGQSSELTVPFASGAVTDVALRQAEERFEDEFERTYGHRARSREFELVTCRTVATITRGVEHTGHWEPGHTAAATTSRPVYFGAEHGLLETRVMPREALARGALPGPLIIQEYDTSVVVPPGCNAALDGQGNIVIDLIAHC